LTFLPLLPLRNVPFLRLRIAFFTYFDAFFEYFLAMLQLRLVLNLQTNGTPR
jgi:hypothetical protein